jgi:RNA polymerase sigma factor (TIGR02999 family)
MDREDITELIREWQAGDHTAENRLFEALYRRLHDIAVRCLRTERPNQTVSATALVHEAYLRFGRSEKLEIANRQHFLSLAARVMRRILVDRARAQKSEKRGGGVALLDVDEALVRTTEDADQILAVDRALDELSRHSARQAHLIELRYFAGYSLEESATVMGVSARTVRREWQIARTRLRIAIDGTTEPD